MLHWSYYESGLWFVFFAFVFVIMSPLLLEGHIAFIHSVPLVVNTSWFFPHSWLITGVCNWCQTTVPLVEQELLTLPEHLRPPTSTPGSHGAHVAPSLVFYVIFYRSLFAFLSFFLLTIVMSVLRFTDSDYAFGIFNLFLCLNREFVIIINHKIIWRLWRKQFQSICVCALKFQQNWSRNYFCIMFGKLVALYV